MREVSPVPSADRAARLRGLVFLTACLTSWLLYLHRYAWGVIKPAFKAEHPELSDTELGWLDSAFMATYTVGQIPGGLAGDLLGPRTVLTLMALLWSGTVAVLPWAGGFAGLLGVRALFGLAQAGVYPVLNRTTQAWFPLRVRTSVQGAVTAFGRVGAACAPLLLATLLMGVLGLSWQASLVILAAPGLLLAVGVWVVFRSGPDAPTEPRPAASRLPLRRSRASAVSFAMLLLYAFASTFADQLFVFWIPLFLKEGRGFDNVSMGLIATLLLLGGAGGGVVGGVLNDVLLRGTGNRRWTRSGVALTGKGLAAVFLVFSISAGDIGPMVALLLASKFFCDWSLPTQWGAITDVAGRSAGTVFGVVNTTGAVGGFVAGPALGYLKQQYGWEAVFHAVAAVFLVSALTWLLIDCTRRLVEEPPTA